VAADGAAALNGTGPYLGFGGAEAAESPRVFEEMVDEFAFGSVGRLPAVGELFGEGAELVGVFAGDDDGAASMPDLRALKRTASLPWSDVGPVDL